MACVLKVWALLIAALINNILINCEPSWTFDIVSVDIENRMPDHLFVDFGVTHPFRGAFATTGIFDIKEDLTDDTHISFSVHYSATGSNYVKTAFFMPTSNLTTFMNIYYKDLIMGSLLNCSDNAPQVEDKFVAPLTKRTIKLNNCIFSNENMPSHVKSGFYQVEAEFRNHVDTDLIFVVEVEPK